MTNLEQATVEAGIHPFQVATAPGEIEDLRRRLHEARWPPDGPVAGWQRGAPQATVRRIVEYWGSGYDWESARDRLNAYGQFITVIDGQPVHFLHVRSPQPDALPLILTHGWPMTFVEYLPLLGPLTDPVAHGGHGGHGGHGDDAFDLIVPSLPGCGFSTPLAGPGWHHHRIAYAWATLMERLGYLRYGVAGGDSGSHVSPLIARTAPDRVVGVHVHGSLEPPGLTDDDQATLTTVERRRLDRFHRLRTDASGYAEIQATRPDTLAYALTDSPVGQLAWVLDKIHDWTDPRLEDIEDAVDLDLLLTSVTVTWLTRTAGSSAQLYAETRLYQPPDDPPGRSETPVGIAVFPHDPTLRTLAERSHRLTQWTEHDRGGHFAALEAPDLLTDDIRSFFRNLRPPST